MADKKITELNLHTSLILSDIIPIINTGETKKTTYGSLYYGIREGVISGSDQISALGFITGVLDVDNYVTTSSYNTDSSSFDQRIINATNEQSLVGFATTGSNTFNENQIISGSLFVSGTTELGGNIVPKTARGATLGTSDRPFSEIFVSSGSINIASDTLGDPNTSISNVDGNLLVSAGGMRLVGDGAFIAATGSFGYISGSMTQIGDYTQIGDKVISGSLVVTNGITSSLLGTSSYALRSEPIGISGTTIYTTTPTTSQVGTTGSIFLGENAGYQSTNSNYSIFLGKEAGYQVNTAANSQFIGERAGYQAWSANNSNFLGKNAGNGATFANNCFFVGSSAGNGAEESNNSIMVGSNSGNGAANAANSLFMGNASGYGAIYADHSTFIGANAGLSAVSASNSTFIGNGAGYSATNASHSIYIGYKAGFGSSTIGPNNIILGTNLTLPVGRRDSMNLGGVIFATGSYASLAGNPLATAVGNGKVGINIVNPIHNLDVSGSVGLTNNLVFEDASITTGSVGSFEYDGSSFYGTPILNHRGLLETKQMYYNTGQVALANNGTQQSLFGLTNGVSVTYGMRYKYKIGATVRVTADNVNLFFALVGTATYYRSTYHATVGKGSYGPGMLPTTVIEVTGLTDGQVKNTINISQGGAGGTYFEISIEGIVDTQYSGYLKPIVLLSPNPGASSYVGEYSYMEIYPIGPATAGNTDTIIGNWS